jgi:protein-tyrosine phosphatase
MIHEILPGQLYQSANLLKMDEGAKRETIRALKISMVANLWRWPDPVLATMWGVGYYHVPMGDGKVIDRETLEALAANAVAHIRAGGRVLTQCHAGRNRSGMLSALIVRELLGVSGPEAVEIVRKARPRAIANPHQEDYLENLP